MFIKVIASPPKLTISISTTLNSFAIIVELICRNN